MLLHNSMTSPNGVYTGNLAVRRVVQVELAKFRPDVVSMRPFPSHSQWNSTSRMYSRE